MNIQGINHFTIRTPFINESLDFYSNVIGMVVGPRPAFLFPGIWMYAGGKPILHIVSLIEPNQHMEAYLGQKEQSQGAGCIDHISLQGTDLSAMQEHLVSIGQPFRERIIPEIFEHQMFIEDPNGVTIELIFPYSPANRVVGEAMPAMKFLS